MAYNITQGSTVEFTVEFLDSSGNLTVPSCATLTMTYTSISGTTASSTIDMTQTNQFFIATWGSGQAKVGFANFSIVASGGAGTPALGQLRLLGP